MKRNIHLPYTYEEIFEIGYWSAALFCSHDESLRWNYNWDDIDEDDRAQCRDELERFCNAVKEIVTTPDCEQMGMDFFYCRKGHGVDFRDRDELTKKQKKDLVALTKRYGDDHKEIWTDEHNKLRYTS